VNPNMRRPNFASDLSLNDVVSTDYDLALVSLGFESRSSHLAKHLQGKLGRKVALGFSKHHALAYEDNLRSLEQLGYELPKIKDVETSIWLKNLLNDTANTCHPRAPHICVDISSLTRLRMAQIVEAIVQGYGTADASPIDVDFVYTVAEFSEPLKQSECSTVCGPVSPFLAGWPTDPEQPVAAIIGLGYELEKAVGALEYLEPTSRILVRPISKDSRFDDEVGVANASLLGERSAAEVFSYPIDKPTQCLELLDALTNRLSDEFRTIAMPFGPKIFALCCMLLACRYYPQLGVWRVSSDDPAQVRDQIPSMTTTGLRVRFGAPASQASRPS
jgi:hypothetical protein